MSLNFEIIFIFSPEYVAMPVRRKWSSDHVKIYILSGIYIYEQSNVQ